jgi:hypothetical protein
MNPLGYSRSSNRDILSPSCAVSLVHNVNRADVIYGVTAAQQAQPFVNVPGS